MLRDREEMRIQHSMREFRQAFNLLFFFIYPDMQAPRCMSGFFIGIPVGVEWGSRGSEERASKAWAGRGGTEWGAKGERQ